MVEKLHRELLHGAIGLESVSSASRKWEALAGWGGSKSGATPSRWGGKRCSAVSGGGTERSWEPGWSPAALQLALPRPNDRA